MISASSSCLPKHIICYDIRSLPFFTEPIIQIRVLLNSREERSIELKPCVFETARVLYLY